MHLDRADDLRCTRGLGRHSAVERYDSRSTPAGLRRWRAPQAGKLISRSRAETTRLPKPSPILPPRACPSLRSNSPSNARRPRNNCNGRSVQRKAPHERHRR